MEEKQIYIEGMREMTKKIRTYINPKLHFKGTDIIHILKEEENWCNAFELEILKIKK